MHVLISTEIEGVARIYHRVQTTPGKPEYERAAADDRSRGRRERCGAAGFVKVFGWRPVRAGRAGLGASVRKPPGEAGALRQATRQAGLSFGDRSCLALAKSRGLVALTAGQAWTHLDDGLGITVELLR